MQRLSHHWKDAVDSSPAIKAKLGIRSQGVRAINPAQFADAQRFPTARTWARIALPMYYGNLTLNPNFYDKALHGLHMRWKEGSPYTRVYDSSRCFWSLPTLSFGSYFKDEHKPPSFGPSRTWRDMYPTHPPITTGVLDLHPGDYYREHHSPSSAVIFVAIREQSGITLGLLHDTIFAALGAEFRGTMASDSVKLFSGRFRFASGCKNLSQQCLQSIFEQ